MDSECEVIRETYAVESVHRATGARAMRAINEMILPLRIEATTRKAIPPARAVPYTGQYRYNAVPVHN